MFTIGWLSSVTYGSCDEAVFWQKIIFLKKCRMLRPDVADASSVVVLVT